jgi:hypothetical protein
MARASLEIYCNSRRKVFPTFSTGLTFFHCLASNEPSIRLDFGWQSTNDCCRHNAELEMTVRLSQQLEQVQSELARKLAEAERIGDCLVELGMRLQQEPWKWSLGWAENTFPVPNSNSPLDGEIVESLDRNRLEWLLEDIRILKRREAELKRLDAA